MRRSRVRYCPSLFLGASLHKGEDTLGICGVLRRGMMTDDRLRSSRATVRIQIQ